MNKLKIKRLLRRIGVLPTRGYKVVARFNTGRLASCTVRGDAMVTYQPGRRAQAPKKYRQRGYHLTAFLSLQAAHAMCVSPTDEIWFADLYGVQTKMPPRVKYMVRIGRKGL